MNNSKQKDVTVKTSNVLCNAEGQKSKTYFSKNE